MDDTTAIAVVVVSHDSEAGIAATLQAVRAQMLPGDELVVVDNVSRDRTVEVVRATAPEAAIVETGANLGFAGGCHRGVEVSRAGLLFFLNPDAVPELGCLAALRACAADRPAWAAWQALVTLADGEHVNTAGNLVHWLGFGWAGGLGRRVDDLDAQPREVGFASGAALVVRRDAWDASGGFDARYFMYGEDLDLCLRLRLSGWGVGVVPAARVAHDYRFVKGDYKWFYLERNRWWTLLGTYPAALLALIAPALLAFEVALLLVSWRGGWLWAKLCAQGAVLRSLPSMLRRRRVVQATRAISPRAFAEHLTASLDSPYLGDAARVPGLAATQGAFWGLVLRRLG